MEEVGGSQEYLDYELLYSWRGDEVGGHDEIVKDVVGKVLAVDASMWFCQAISQPKLADLSDEAKCLKVIFERCVNWLRYGVTPVLVIPHLITYTASSRFW